MFSPTFSNNILKIYKHLSSSQRAQLQLGYIEQLFSGWSTSVVVTLYVLGEYTLFYIKNVVFFMPGWIFSFSADFSPKIFLYYCWIIIEKERIYHRLFAVCSFFFYLYTIRLCISRTIHRTVISTEHLAITNSGLFILLGSFAVRGSNNLIWLR